MLVLFTSKISYFVINIQKTISKRLIGGIIWKKPRKIYTSIKSVAL